MTLPFSTTGCQPNSVRPIQQVADAAGLVIGRRAMVGEAIDELLVLGADPPVVARLLAAGEHREQVVAALDRAGLRRSSVRVVMRGALSGGP